MPRLVIDLKDEELAAMRSWLFDEVVIRPDAGTPRWEMIKALRNAVACDPGGCSDFAHHFDPGLLECRCGASRREATGLLSWATHSRLSLGIPGVSAAPAATKQPHGDRRDHRDVKPPFVMQFRMKDADISVARGFQIVDALRHSWSEFRITVTSSVTVHLATRNLVGEPVWGSAKEHPLYLTDEQVIGLLLPALINGAADHAQVSHTPNHTPVYHLGHLSIGKP